MNVTYCPCCGSMLRPAAKCFKGCAVAPVAGTMADAIAQQGVYLAQQAARPVVTAAPSPYARAARTAPAPTARIVRAPWQRRCTCGHCMECIGE